MFSLPRMVIKGGEVLVDDGEIRGGVVGSTLRASVDYNRDILKNLPSWFNDRYSVEFANFAIREDEVEHLVAVEASDDRAT
jgi:formylmethanofuran dehydrogenase subunit A